MADGDEATPVGAPRVGSNADLARRMDRMESRQDSMETEVRTLSATVARVEMNQAHAVELSKLRFDAIESGMKSGFADLLSFQQRIEGILDGTIQTTSSRSSAELIEDYRAWRKEVDEHIESSERREDRRAGALAGISNTKAVVITVSTVIMAGVAFAGFLLTVTRPPV